ncbi:hypothetical protein P4310_32170 [Bacillus thuringiensis]|nr:hypothetical protein [Bacillus cereus]MEB9190474.1 hypothetical protein [Bacillus cereus]MEB9608343.1 hypothetical protein [Bacillus cereus]MED3070032.1 hypothetical protein [Bacillus thuringiensis]
MKLNNVFNTNQSDLLMHNGKTFTLVRPMNDNEYDAFDGVVMYIIRLSTGEELQVFEDEIYS